MQVNEEHNTTMSSAQYHSKKHYGNKNNKKINDKVRY